MIHKQDVICIKTRDITRKKQSLSNPRPNFKRSLKTFISLDLSFMILRTRNKRVNFTNLYSLPIFASLTKPFTLDALKIHSKGKMARTSTVNHPLRYFIDRYFLSSISYKYSSWTAELKMTIISIRKSISTIPLKMLQFFKDWPFGSNARLIGVVMHDAINTSTMKRSQFPFITLSGYIRHFFLCIWVVQAYSSSFSWNGLQSLSL